MVSCGSKNGHQKDTCSKAIGLRRARNILTIFSLIVNMIGEIYMRTRIIFTLIINEIIHMSSKNHEANDDRHNSDSLIIAQYSPVCFVSYEKWVQRGKYPKNTRLNYLIGNYNEEWLAVYSGRCMGVEKPDYLPAASVQTVRRRIVAQTLIRSRRMLNGDPPT